MGFYFNVNSLTPSKGGSGGGGTVVIETLIIDPSTSEQTFSVGGGIDGYGPITVNPVTASIDQNIIAGNIKSGVEILGVTGNVVELNATPTTVTPTTSEQTITPQGAYNGFSTITVDPVTSSIDSNIVAGNIKKDVKILNVTGTYELNLTTKSITANGTYVASSDNADGYSSVTVNVAGPASSYNPVPYTGGYNVGNNIDTTSFLNADVICGNISSTQGAQYTAFTSNAKAITGSSIGQYYTNLTEIKLDNLQYIFNSNFFINGTSSNKFPNITGLLKFPKLYGFIGNTQGVSLMKYAENVTGFSAPNFSVILGCGISSSDGHLQLYNGPFDYCPALEYINLSSYAGTPQGKISRYLISTSNTKIQCLMLGDVKEIGSAMVNGNSASDTNLYNDFKIFVFNTTTVPTLGNVQHIILNFSNKILMPHFDTNGDGKIYVPDALVDSYKAATNWSALADFIKPLSQFVNTWES